jgi:DNA-binding Lrp family transcriptional regulator
MATKAYILLETKVGKSRAVVERLQSLDGVVGADAVTGGYDVIAVVSAPDLNAIGDLVTSRIHTIDGIERTVTCLSVSGD